LRPCEYEKKKKLFVVRFVVRRSPITQNSKPKTQITPHLPHCWFAIAAVGSVQNNISHHPNNLPIFCAR
jgi:hypothetical protein